MRKFFFGLCAAMGALLACGSITVSDVQVFSGYPWKEVVVGYMITGADADADFVRLTATDKLANKSYTATTLTGADFTEGRHVLRWNAAAQGVKFSSTNVVFSVSVIGFGGVQLWENGPHWAECNVGASKPEECGYYFWWGDTVGYTWSGGTWNGSVYRDVTWVSSAGQRISSSPFSQLSCPTYNKNNSTLQSEGYIDATSNLVAKYDAATAHLGAPWRMPTDAEWQALIDKCTTTWTTRNGVYGRLVTGKGGYASRSIFLPAAGGGNGSYFRFFGSGGFCWSSTPNSDYFERACYLIFGSRDFSRSDFSGRYEGLPVRPLRGFAE